MSDNVQLRMCKYGCGHTVAPGLTRKGNPYDTCCRECAGNAGGSPSQHSSYCVARQPLRAPEPEPEPEPEAEPEPEPEPGPESKRTNKPEPTCKLGLVRTSSERVLAQAALENQRKQIAKLETEQVVHTVAADNDELTRTLSKIATIERAQSDLATPPLQPTERMQCGDEVASVNVEPARTLCGPELDGHKTARPPVATCLKQKPRLKTWKERIAKIEGCALNFYDLSEKKRGSSIENVAGCRVVADGRHGKFFLIELQRRGDAVLPDLDDAGSARFCFAEEADRDSFATALRNLSAGRQWNAAVEPVQEGVPVAKVEQQAITLFNLADPGCNGDYELVGKVGGQSHWRCEASGLHLFWGKHNIFGLTNRPDDEVDIHVDLEGWACQGWLLSCSPPGDVAVYSPQDIRAVCSPHDLIIGENRILTRGAKPSVEDRTQWILEKKFAAMQGAPDGGVWAPGWKSNYGVFGVLTIKLTLPRTAHELRLAAARAAPQWCSDVDAPKCMLCGEKEFNFYERRHHCRYCGLVVCNVCRKDPDGNDLELAVDRWCSSRGAHAVSVLQGGRTKVKKVCRSCFKHAPQEMVRRQSQHEQLPVEMMRMVAEDSMKRAEEASLSRQSSRQRHIEEVAKTEAAASVKVTMAEATAKQEAAAAAADADAKVAAAEATAKQEAAAAAADAAAKVAAAEATAKQEAAAAAAAAADAATKVAAADAQAKQKAAAAAANAAVKVAAADAQAKHAAIIIEQKHVLLHRDQEQNLLNAQRRLLEADMEAAHGTRVHIRSAGEGTYVGFRAKTGGANRHVIRFRTAQYQIKGRRGTVELFSDPELQIPLSRSNPGKLGTTIAAGTKFDVLETHTTANGNVSLRCAGRESSRPTVDGWLHGCYIDQSKAKEVIPQEREVKLKGTDWTVITTSGNMRPQWEREESKDNWAAYPMHVNAYLEEHQFSQTEFQFTCDWSAAYANSEPEPEPEPEPELAPDPKLAQRMSNSNTTKKEKKGKPNTKSTPTGPNDFSVDFSADKSSLEEVHALTGERRAVRRITVACTDNVIISASGFPEYFGHVEIAEGSGGLALEDLRCDTDLLRKLDACLQPEDASQLGKGADATGWRGIPAARRRLKLVRAWRVHNRALWAKYMAEVNAVADQMTQVPKHRACPIDFRAAFEAATADLPGKTSTDTNEHYLLSGVPKDTVEKILMTGMNERFSGANAGTMFGEGVYCKPLPICST